MIGHGVTLRRSVVTCRATGQLARRFDVVFLDKARSQTRLRFANVFGLPRHIEDLVTRPNVLGWIAVAVQTPLHRVGLVFVDELHLIDPPVAGHTSNPLLHVDTVVEINVIAEVVDAIPLQRLSRLPTDADGFEHRRAKPDLLMAIHACRNRGHIGEGRVFDRGMAVAALNA